MAKQYQVVGAYAAQVPVDGPQGVIRVDFNQGAILPEGVPQEKIDHLLDVGLIAEVGSDEPEQPAEERSEPPAKSASKSAWVAYAVSQGATEEDADKASKDDLVALYGGGE